MTIEEAIAQLNTFKISAKSELGENALKMAIKALEQQPCVVNTKDLSDDEIKKFEEIMKKATVQVIPKEPCEDCVSREQAKLAIRDRFKNLPSRVEINTILNELPSVTPTRIETVTEFADRCRECGKTAITRAENDEILNEAWVLLMSVTEEDGVSTEEANGMLKLMAFFFL